MWNKRNTGTQQEPLIHNNFDEKKKGKHLDLLIFLKMVWPYLSDVVLDELEKSLSAASRIVNSRAGLR